MNSKFVTILLTVVGLGEVMSVMNWSDWSDCSSTCGLGLQIRTCTGGCQTNQEKLPCIRRVCPGNTWNEWSSWTACSATCGPGNRNRVRGCDGGACVGQTTETPFCLMTPCPVRGVATFDEWTAWTACSVTCGPGQKQRQRVCTSSAEECAKLPAILTAMSLFCLVEPCLTNQRQKVGVWGQWSPCSQTCGGGRSNRTRSCVAGGIGDLVGGLVGTGEVGNLVGNLINSAGNPGVQGDAGTIASGILGKVIGTNGVKTGGVASAGNILTGILDGVKSGSIKGNGGINDVLGGFIGAEKNTKCKHVLSEETVCNPQQCPGDAKLPEFGDWTTWTPCSQTCGMGERKRSRECTSASPEARIKCDAAVKAATQTCNQVICRSSWAEWTEWTACSKSCGPGDKTRVRGCPAGGCIGLPSERLFCMTTPTCPKIST